MNELGLKMRLKLSERETSGKCVKNQIWKMGYVAALHDLDDLTDEPSLNKNQKLVLLALKKEGTAKIYLEDVLSDLNNDCKILPEGAYEAYVDLNDFQFAQVLEVYSKWVQEEER